MDHTGAGREIEQSERAFVHRVSRRGFLGAVGLPIVAAFNPSDFYGQTQDAPIFLPSAPHSRAYDFASLDQWITPNSQFFVRSHFGTPSLSRLPWTVRVTGAVNRDRAFTAEELLKLPRTDAVVTLECAGNPVGWGGVSNARWTGVPLSVILEAAGLRPDATEVVLAGADGGIDREAGGLAIESFARSIPLSKAIDPHTILAYRMNGEALPAEHGGPLRAIVPGWYGMDSVKWLKQIVVSNRPFTGFYQTDRYYEARRANGQTERQPLRAMRVKSQIARLTATTVQQGQSITITGAAWTGEAEVELVELSFDGGHLWKKARLGADRSQFAWRLWYYDWLVASAGGHEVTVRARDTRGRMQPLERDPLVITPYANNWVDRRTIDVR